MTKKQAKKFAAQLIYSGVQEAYDYAEDKAEQDEISEADCEKVIYELTKMEDEIHSLIGITHEG